MDITETLFQPLRVGNLTLRNRIVLSPMTRHRSTLEGVPTALNVEYYRQRASAGLIITEGTYPCDMGRGYLFTPGICTEAQITGWRRVTDAVHAQGGLIVCQLMHCGRLSDPLVLPGNVDPIAPSAVPPDPKGRYTQNCPRANRPYPRPRALTTAEVYGVIDDFRRATEHAAQAGFDGVEIHGGNGYLPMQFFSTNVNVRNDEFGGSPTRRAQFALSCVDAIASVKGASYVAIKIAPSQHFADIMEENPISTYSYLTRELSRRGIAYLHVSRRKVAWDVLGTLRRIFDGPIVGVGGFSRTIAAEAIATRTCDLTAFGQAYLANPDLAERYHEGWTVNRPDSATYYTQGAGGYTDYPPYDARDPAKQLPPDSAFAPALQAERSAAQAG
jgi:N-ethylmaleimide reductase